MKMYKKLVRDRIPELFIADGQVCVSRILDQEAYKVELLKKIIEEAREVVDAASDKEHLIKELADLFEVIGCVEHVFGVTRSEVESTQHTLRDKKGSFKNRVYLESVE